MVSPTLKQKLYEAGFTISDIARDHEIPVTSDRKAIERWHGKVGNPRGKTREVLKTVESIIGEPVYQEAS